MLNSEYANWFANCIQSWDIQTCKGWSVLYWLSLYPTILSVKNGLLKTLWEKEKMLVTSIFSFSHIVFYPIQHKCNHNKLSSANGFNFVQSKSLSVHKNENIAGKKKMLVTSIFSFTRNVYKSLSQLIKSGIV